MTIAADPCPVGLRGIVPAMNTPFDADGAVDLAGVRRCTRFLIAAGCAGALVPAVAAEVGSLSVDERRAIVAAVLEEAAGRLPVIVGLSGLEPAARLATARAADREGAAGVLYNPPPEERGAALETALAGIAETGVPLIMLQDLDWTGAGIPFDQIVRLFERIPAFRALKVEVVPAGPKYRAVLEATAGRMHTSGGWAAGQMIEALQYGVHAFMPTAMEPLYVRVFSLFRGGDVAAARALFERMLPALAFANQHVNVSIRFLKMLRVAEGVFATARCRPPVPAFDAVQSAEAEHLIRRIVAEEEVSGRLPGGTPAR